MEKKELVQFLNDIFFPIDFKRKGNYWVNNGKFINKIVNLQKSQYSNAYYLNYGYIINSLELNNFKEHIPYRLGSSDSEQQKKITELLDLDTNIIDKLRFSELRKIINNEIVLPMQVIHTEEDLLQVLKGMRYRYTIPPFVLKYFNLSVDGQ